MLRNYLLVTLRNLHRHRAYASINILGLAVGITCSVLILLFVRDELSYDRFHDEADHIYRVISHVGEDELLVTPSLIAPHLERTMPVVEKTARVFNQTAFGPLVVRNEEQMFQETRFFYADSSFFQIFSFPFVSGDPRASLVRPRTVVMTQSMARKYFGQDDPLGRVLLVDGVSYEISGVIEDLPENTHLKFDFVASLVTRSNWPELSDSSWRSANFSTYLLMRDSGGQEAVLHELSGLAEREIGEWLQQMGRSYRFVLQPVTSIHFETRNTRAYVYIFSLIGLLILLVACINYMNLATARALRRAREVGVRKMMGASRWQLIRQFYCEALLLTGIALLFALLFIELALPAFNVLSGKQLAFAAAGGYAVPLALAGVWLVVALLAGSYPALVLSQFEPVSVLKHAMKTSAGAVLFRRGLVVFQFAISAFLIFGTIVVVEQLSFLRDHNLGYSKEQVIVLPVRNQETLRSELLSLAGVSSVAAVDAVPGHVRAGYSASGEGLPEDRRVPVSGLIADAGLLPTLEMEFAAGRNFTTERLSGQGYEYLLNETAAKAMGWTVDEAVGRWFTLGGDRQGQVAGVVRDFHFVSLHEAIAPLVIFQEPWQHEYLLVRIAGANTPEMMAMIEEVWRKVVSDRPFEYTFLDQEYAALYDAEERASSVTGLFALLAVFIACLGLFGLAAFAAEQRTKEIGVRKVLGASITTVVGLLSKDFARLVLVACVIAAPVGYIAMNRWLEGFAYRIEPGLWIFGLTLSIVLLTALATVSSQALKAAMADPVKALKYE